LVAEDEVDIVHEAPIPPKILSRVFLHLKQRQNVAFRLLKYE
jgi:hypothetical protein